MYSLLWVNPVASSLKCAVLFTDDRREAWPSVGVAEACALEHPPPEVHIRDMMCLLLLKLIVKTVQICEEMYSD